MNKTLLAVLPLLVVLIIAPAYAQEVPSEFRQNEEITLEVPQGFILVEGIRNVNSYTEQYTDDDENTLDIFTSVTAPEYIMDYDSTFVPYVKSENSLVVTVSSAKGSFVFDKTTCGATFFEGKRIEQSSVAIIDSNSFIVRTAINGTDIWNNIDSVNNASCVTEIYEDGNNIEVRGIKESTDGLLKIRYMKLFDQGIKPQIEFTPLNPAWTNNKYGIIETNHIPNDIKINDKKYKVNDNNGLQLGRDKIKDIDNTSLEVDFGNNFKYKSLSGKDQLWSVNLINTGFFGGNINKIVFDYSNQDRIYLPGETLILDPLYSSPTETQLIRLKDTAELGTSCSDVYDTSDTFAHVHAGDSDNVASCHRTVYEFPTSSIPDYAKISNSVLEIDVVFMTFVDSLDIYEIEPDEDISVGDQTLWDDADDGTPYVDDSTAINAVADDIRIDLGVTFNSDLETKLQAGINNIKFALTIDNNVREPAGNSAASLENAQLMITYTLPTPTAPAIIITFDTDFDTAYQHVDGTGFDLTIGGDVSLNGTAAGVQLISGANGIGTTIAGIDVSLKRTGSPTGVVSAHIYDDNGITKIATSQKSLVNFNLVNTFYGSAEEITPLKFTFSTNGTLLYIAGAVNDEVNQYRLTTPWDVSTASFDNAFMSLGGEMSVVGGDMQFKPDGTMLFIVDRTSDELFQYNLTIPWDIDSGSYSGISSGALDLIGPGHSTGAITPMGFYIKPDGTKLFVTSQTGGQDIHEYGFEIPWDISTLTYDRISWDLCAPSCGTSGTHISDDGLNLYTVDQGDDGFNQFTFRIPWDLQSVIYSTQTSSDESRFVTAGFADPSAQFVSPDGLYFYTVDAVSGVKQYTTTTAFEIPWATTYQDHKFYFTTSRTLEVDDRIVIEFTGGNSTNYISLETNTTTIQPNYESTSRNSTGDWNEVTTDEPSINIGLEKEKIVQVYVDSTTPIGNITGYYYQRTETNTTYTSACQEPFTECGSLISHIGFDGPATGLKNMVYGNVTDNLSYLDSEDALQVHYTFDTDNGIVNQGSLGSSANGTNNGATTGVVGKYNEAYDFNGTTDSSHITLPDDTLLDNQDYTISLWFNARACTSNTALFDSLSSTTEQQELQIRLTSSCDVIGFKRTDGSTSDADVVGSGQVLNLVEWNHIAFVYDDSIANDQANVPTDAYRLYINGVLDDNTPSDSNYAGGTDNGGGNNYRLGASSISGADFEGKIDDFRIYNRTLSDLEVQFLGEAFVVLDSKFPTIPEIVYEFDNPGRDVSYHQVGNQGASLKIGGDASLNGTAVGVKIEAGATAIGLEIDQIHVSLRAIGEPTGNFSAHIYDDDGVTKVASTEVKQLGTFNLNGIFDLTGGGDEPFFGLFRDDGTSMYISDGDTNKITQYNMTTPWDVTTAVFYNDTALVVGEFWFKPDGTKMYFPAGGSCPTCGVTEYNMTTPWDIGTLVSHSFFTIFDKQLIAPDTIAIHPNGTSIYGLFYFSQAGNNFGGAIHILQYNVTTPWDFSTVTQPVARHGSFIYDGGQFESKNVLVFSPNGEHLWVGWTNHDTANAGYVDLILSTPWDISTIVKAHGVGVVGAECETPGAIMFGDDGDDSRLYSITASSRSGPCPIEVAQYDLSVPNTLPFHNIYPEDVPNRDGITLKFNTTRVLEVGDRIVIEYAGGNSTSYMELEATTKTIQPNYTSTSRNSTGHWNEVTTIEPSITIGQQGDFGLWDSSFDINSKIVNIAKAGFTLTGTNVENLGLDAEVFLEMTGISCTMGVTPIEDCQGWDVITDTNGFAEGFSTGTGYRAGTWQIDIPSTVNSDHESITYDVGSLPDKWLLQVNMRISYFGNSDTPMEFWFGMSDSKNEPDGLHDFIGISGVNAGSNTRYDWNNGNGVTLFNSYQGDFSASTNDNDRSYQFEIARIDDTTASYTHYMLGGLGEEYMPPDFSGNCLSVGSCNSRHVDTFATGIDDLRYIYIGWREVDGNSNGNFGIVIDDIKLYIGDTGSGTTNDGAISPDNFQLGSSGLRGTSLVFNGTSATFVDLYPLQATSSSYLESRTAGTISIWINPNEAETSTTQCIICASDSADASSEFVLGISNNEVTISVREAGTFALDAVTTGDPIQNDQWTHLVWTQDTTGNILYVNDVPQTLTYSTGSASTDAWFDNVLTIDSISFGRNVDSTGAEWFYNGKLDDYAYFTTARPHSEVSRLYNDGESLDVVDAWNKNTNELSTVRSVLKVGTEQYVTNSTARIGGSAFFDGSTYYTTATESESNYEFEYNEQKSFSFWVNLDDNGVFKYILDKRNDAGGASLGYYIAFDGTEKLTYAQLSSSGYEACLTDNAIPLAWSHVVITDGGTDDECADVNIYFNGVNESLSSTGVGPLNTSTFNDADVTIGSRYNNVNQLVGLLDDIRIYRTVLTADEVLILYHYSELSGTRIFNTNLLPDLAYKYRAQGVNQNGFGDFSVYTSDQVEITFPTTPSNFIVSTVVNGLDLSWNESFDGGNPIIGYKIERESPVGGGFVPIVSDTGNNNTFYNDTSVNSATQYSYRISAINSIGFSQGALAFNWTFPDAPINPSAVPKSTTADQINLEWTAPSGTINGYVIERESPIGDGFVVIESNCACIGNYYNDTGLVEKTQYNYRIAAITNPVGPFSPPFNATTGDAPDAPLNVIASIVDPDLDPLNILLSWDAPIDIGDNTVITGYDIIRSVNATAYVSLVNDTAGLTYNDLAVITDNNYTYAVGAKGDVIDGNFSAASNTITIPVVPDAPTGLMLSVPLPDTQPFQINVNWTNGDNGGSAISLYTIWRSTDDVVFVNITATSSKPYLDTVPPIANTTYYYKVQAKNGIGYGANSTSSSQSVAGLPGAPTNVVGLPKAGNTSIQINWVTPIDDGGSAIVGYRIQEQINGGGYSTIVTDTGTTLTTYTRLGLSDNNLYEYNITAINSIGLGAGGTTATGIEFTIGTVTFATKTIGNVNVFTPTVDITWGLPDTYVTDLELYRNAVLIDTYTPLFPQQIVKGANFTFINIYDTPFPAGSYNYHYITNTRNGEGGQARAFQSSTIQLTTFTLESGNNQLLEFRNTNYNASTFEFISSPINYTLVIAYQEANSDVTPLYYAFDNVEINATYTSTVNSNIKYYLSAYLNPTFSYDVGTPGNATIPIGYPITVSTISQPNPNTVGFALGIDTIAGDSGIFGLPLVFIFVIALASIFTGRSAPMGIIFIGVALGIMAYLGLIDFNFDPSNDSSLATWALIIIAIIIGVMVGKRWD